MNFMSVWQEQLNNSANKLKKTLYSKYSATLKNISLFLSVNALPKMKSFMMEYVVSYLKGK